MKRFTISPSEIIPTMIRKVVSAHPKELTEYTHLVQWEEWQIPQKHVPKYAFTFWISSWLSWSYLSNHHVPHERICLLAWTVLFLRVYWHSFSCRLHSLPRSCSVFLNVIVWHSFILCFYSFTIKCVLKFEKNHVKISLPWLNH